MPVIDWRMPGTRTACGALGVFAGWVLRIQKGESALEAAKKAQSDVDRVEHELAAFKEHGADIGRVRLPQQRPPRRQFVDVGGGALSLSIGLLAHLIPVLSYPLSQIPRRPRFLAVVVLE